MAQNFHSKYSPAVVERYKKKSITNVAFGTNGYDWTGAKTINVTSVSVPALNPYDRAATANRFGTPTEVDTTGQDLTLTQDFGREQIIDFGNQHDTGYAVKAAEHLKRVTDEVITPAIDVYRLGVLKGGIDTATTWVSTGATTSDNAYDIFLDVNAKVSDSFAPEVGRVAFATRKYFNFLKTGKYTTNSDAGMKVHENGVIDVVDGVKIVEVPSSWMPTGVDLMIVHPDAVVGPVALKNYRNLGPQQGYDGDVLQWRVYFDAFVLDAKKNAMAGHKAA